MSASARFSGEISDLLRVKKIKISGLYNVAGWTSVCWYSSNKKRTGSKQTRLARE